MTIKDMTGIVTDIETGPGIPIDFPQDGDEGFWTPSDQQFLPITPIQVTFYKGMWYSFMAYMSLSQK